MVITLRIEKQNTLGGSAMTHLSEDHRKMLEVESSISPEVIEARGYRTITKDEARKFGFTGHQSRDGLLLPIYTTDGQNGLYMLRPDAPRSLDDKAKGKLPDGTYPQKVFKYEWPKGTEPRIDCHPAILPMLKDPTIPLWITEGIKKGDALATWELCVIDLPVGVWGWKSKRDGISADLDSIVWTDRDVYIVFDSDVATKPNVDQARRRLTINLSHRGAKVVPVPLPAKPGEKLGVDDFKAKGGTLAELWGYANAGRILPLQVDDQSASEIKSTEYLEALSNLGYSFRMNDMDDTLEVNRVPLSDPLECEIRTKLRDVGYKQVNVARDAFIAYAHRRRYHPVKDYLVALEWDGYPRIAELATYFKDGHETVYGEAFNTKDYPGAVVFQMWLTRWLIGAVAKVMNQEQNMMLVLDGPQGCGKSHFVQWLGSVLPDHFIEAPVNPDDKDVWLRLIRNFIWEVGELGATTRRADREALKNFITVKTVTVRPPYGKNDMRKYAVASLVGTINNEAGFLTDPTGNRRFLSCNIQAINWDYAKQLDAHQVWAEAVAKFQQGKPWLPTRDEVKLQNVINDEYMVERPLREMLFKYYEIKPGLDVWTPAMDIVTKLETMGLRGNQYQLLKDLADVMKSLGVEQRRTRIDGKKIRGYQGVFEINL